MKVLIVDDDKNSRTLLRDLLKLKNVDCIEAGSGNEALALVSSEIGLCITDIKLPDIDGYEVARKIKEKYPEMPIIVSTGSVSVAERIKMESMKLFAATLIKPIDIKNFSEVMSRFIKNT